MERHARGSRARWRRHRSEAGYAALMVALMVPTVFLGLAAVGIDTARWYLEAERVQAAADAAALAGVPFLPQDLPSARGRALEVAARNGYDDTAGDVVVTVAKGARESQLRVTVSSAIHNQFGALIGVPNATIVRTAVADFTGPAPMGSPCNVFGSEPDSGPPPAATVSGNSGASAIGKESTRPANCPRNPEFWATVEGPQTGKVQGDRYGTRTCEESGVDGCDSSRRNEEYNEAGYFWLVKVQPSMVGRPIGLQVYDPAFVRTGMYCTADGLPDYGSLPSNMNPYAVNDAKARYGEADSPGYPALSTPYCTGDDFVGGATGSKNKMTTTFLVREQTDSQDPLQAAVQDDALHQPCAKQFGSYTSYPSASVLDKGDPAYRPELAQVFHNWVEICTFTPQRAGDYYLQVRTNKSFGFAGSALMRDVPRGALDDVAAAKGDSSPVGGGSNAFAVRAVTPSGLERGVAVSGWDRMPIFANAEEASLESPTIFPLIRILPGAAGQFISFEFFDAGDAADVAKVRVRLPYEVEGTIAKPFPNGCSATGGSAGSGQSSSESDCAFTLTRSGGVSRNNGKTQTIKIPIPATYTCDATVFTSCWYRVEIGFSTGEVHDVTTWDAEIVGDPVRLIE